MRHKNMVILLLVLVGAALSMPTFGQTGIRHSVDNTTNPNTQNATNSDAAVPPTVPGATEGFGQPAIPDVGPSMTTVTGGSSGVAYAVGDPEITVKIKRALYVDGATSGNEIHVTTDDGVVTLTGQVHAQHEALEAARIAQITPGVRAVVNQLIITTNRSANG